MKRAFLCVPDPWNYYDQLQDWSIMTVNPDSTTQRQNYLLDNSDWSMKITPSGVEYRDGCDYPNERLFWYTSGTTGDSKFCSFTQLQLDNLATTIGNTYNLSANDRYVSIMPLWHAHGQGFYWAAKQAGCEINFVASKHIRSMPKHSPTFITAIPDVLKVIADLKFDSLRFIRSASAPLSTSLYTQLQDQFNVPVIEAFGMTEALSHCFTNPLNGEQRIGTVGLPSGINADIIDGHLYIQGPTVFQTGWYDTGDLAEQDSAGYYRILGRSVDQLNIKGKKFNPVSLETQLLTQFTMINECVVFGDHELNCLYVGDCKSDDIKKFLRSLDLHLKPVLLSQVDTIPRAPSGKISRSYLKKHFNCK